MLSYYIFYVALVVVLPHYFRIALHKILVNFIDRLDKVCVCCCLLVVVCWSHCAAYEITSNEF